MGKENFEDFINPQEEKEITDGVIEDYAEEGIEELAEKELKDPTELTKINIFRGFVSNLIEELEEDPDILEKSAYFKAVYEGIEQRAYSDENEEIRKEAQDALDQINDLVNN